MEGLGHALMRAALHCIWLTKHTNAGGADRAAGAQTNLATWRCALRKACEQPRYSTECLVLVFFRLAQCFPCHPFRSFVRCVSTVRWPPQDGQPTPTIATCLTKGFGHPLRGPSARSNKYLAREHVRCNERRICFVFRLLTRGLTFDMRGD